MLTPCTFLASTIDPRVCDLRLDALGRVVLLDADGEELCRETPEAASWLVPAGLTRRLEGLTEGGDDRAARAERAERQHHYERSRT